MATSFRPITLTTQELENLSLEEIHQKFNEQTTAIDRSLLATTIACSIFCCPIFVPFSIYKRVQMRNNQSEQIHEAVHQDNDLNHFLQASPEDTVENRNTFLGHVNNRLSSMYDLVLAAGVELKEEIGQDAAEKYNRLASIIEQNLKTLARENQVTAQESGVEATSVVLTVADTAEGGNALRA